MCPRIVAVKVFVNFEDEFVGGAIDILDRRKGSGGAGVDEGSSTSVAIA